MNNQRLAIINLVSFLIVIGLFSFYWFSPKKIAYIDSQILMSEYQGMLDAREQYKSKEAIWKANIDSLTQEVRQAITQYEKDAVTLSEKERELSEQLIRTKQQQLQQYQQAISLQAQQEDQAMTNRVLDQINAYIEEFGKNHDYEVILVATQMGNIAYAADGIDITAEILEGLNKRYGGQ